MIAANKSLKNVIDGKWPVGKNTTLLKVINPVTGEWPAKAPQSSAAAIDRAAKVAVKAFDSWQRMPSTKHIQNPVKLNDLLKEHIKDI